MSSRKDFKKYLFDKIQDFPGYWEPCKHNWTWTGCKVDLLFPSQDFISMIPLCIMAIQQKKKKDKKRGRKEEGGHPGKLCFHVEEACHQLIVRKVLNKKDLGAAESCLFQCGWVGLLLSGEAGQDSAREVCNYLKLLWGFFQWEKEVIYYLWKENMQVNGHVINYWRNKSIHQEEDILLIMGVKPCGVDCMLHRAWFYSNP